MSKRFLSQITLTIGTFFLGTSTLGAATIRETQGELTAWVDTQKVIAETKANWTAEKEIVEDLIGLLENEKEKLSESIDKLDEGSDATDKLRTELNADKEKLLASTEALEEIIPQLETETRNLIKKLPDPLKEEISPLLSRLPKKGAATRMPVSQRLLTVVGILNKIDKFNTGISITSEIRSVGDKSVEVKTLYYGLAGAYFASDNAEYAGTGAPGEDGWIWTENTEAGDEIVDLIRTYEGAREATFVALPVNTL